MRRPRKKYSPPRHPWRMERIVSEKSIIKEFGLKNHMEIWRAEGRLRNWKSQAKGTIKLEGEQKTNAELLLVSKLARIGVLKEGATIDDILRLTIRDVLERRLQTIVYRKGLARTQKQSRQIIVHNKVLVNGKKVNSPSLKVKITDEVSLVPGFIVQIPKLPEQIQTPEEIETEAKEAEVKV